MNGRLKSLLLIFHLLVGTVLVLFPPAESVEFSAAKMELYRNKVKAMFYHAYDGYLTNAFPLDELNPIGCKGMDTWGSFSLTLVDALDTLLIMGNSTEFARASRLLLDTVRVDANVNVSVFETNIRVIGGLLSAHMLGRHAQAEFPLEPGWPCSGPLLRLAERMANKLLPAFNTETGMPYGTVNLRYGRHRFETPVTCTAGVGTFLLEFGTLSRLTGNPHYERIALKALDALWKARSSLGLVGNHINVQTGGWTATDSGLGAGVDSYFEYLVKSSLLFQRPALMRQFQEYVRSINKWVRKEDWFMWVTMSKGQVSMPVFQSLEAFWPGVLTLTGDVESAQRIMFTYQQVLKQYGFLPEFYNIPNQEAMHKRAGYPLRPEFIESLVYLYKATEDPYLLQLGAEIVEAIEYSCKTKCGYATVVNVKDHLVEDRMESFFLAETTKYLYLLFDPDNFMHNDGETARVVNTPNGKCVVEAGGYIYNTEAHPIDPGIVYCCSAAKHREAAMIQSDLPAEIRDLADNSSDRHSSTTFDSDEIGYEVDDNYDQEDDHNSGNTDDDEANVDNITDKRARSTSIGVDASPAGEKIKANVLVQPPHLSLDAEVASLLKEARARLDAAKAKSATTVTPSPGSPAPSPGQAVPPTDEVAAPPVPGPAGPPIAHPKKDTAHLTDAFLTAFRSVIREWRGLLTSSDRANKLALGSMLLQNDELQVVDYVSPCVDCCRRLERAQQTVSLKRLLNAFYSKHVYPQLGVNFSLGPVCLPEEDKMFDDYVAEVPRFFANSKSADQGNGLGHIRHGHGQLQDSDPVGVDRLALGSFKYRTLAKEHYQLLTSPVPLFHARFTGLGQVTMKSA